MNTTKTEKQPNIKKTTEQFNKELQLKENTDYAVVSEYVGANAPILIKHTPCGQVIKKTASDTLRKDRKLVCPLCDFTERLHKLIGDDYVVVSSYPAPRETIAVKHAPCGSVMKRKPSDFLRENRKPRCTKCLWDEQTKTTSWFKKEVYVTCGDEYTVVGEYVSAKTKITMTHNLCGKAWQCTPDNFIRRNSRCPKCSSSRGEQLVREVLQAKAIRFVEQKEFDGCLSPAGRKLRFDFYLPEMSVVIEYNGEQHYKVKPYFHGKDPAEARIHLRNQQVRDTIKETYCNQNNISFEVITYKAHTYEMVEGCIDNIITKYSYRM